MSFLFSSRKKDSTSPRSSGTRSAARSATPSLIRTHLTEEEQQLNELIEEVQKKKNKVLEVLEKVPTCRTGPINCNPIRRKKNDIKQYFEVVISGHISHFSKYNNMEGLRMIGKLCDIYINNLENYTNSYGVSFFEKHIKDIDLYMGMLNEINYQFRKGGKNKTQKRRKNGKTRKSRK